LSGFSEVVAIDPSSCGRIEKILNMELSRNGCVATAGPANSGMNGERLSKLSRLKDGTA
jgi:hypothetical protein